MKSRWFLILLIVVLSLGWPSLSAQAHAIDSANIDQYTRLEIGVKSVHVHYILNMGDLPAYLERRAIDTNVDAELSAEEQAAYLSKKIPELLARMSLTVNNLPVELRLLTKNLSFPVLGVPDIDGGLITMLLVLDLEAQLPEISGSTNFEYHNDNFTDGNGWREIVVRPLGGLSLSDPALQQDLTNELQAYPTAMKSTPLDVRSVTFSVLPPGGATQQVSATPQPAGLPRPAQSDDKFAGLIAAPALTPQVIFFSLLLSLVLGASHALTPGHGKTIVGAYLVGNRGKAKDAIILGLTTTLTHTIGVFALGFITMFVANYILPEQLFPWLELLSGVLVVVIGLSMFWQRLVDLLRYGYVPQHHHDHSGHDHPHEHHEHGPHSHSHIPAGSDGQPVSLRGLLTLGISGGLLPCPSALVVMLGAIALNRVAFGMVLIFAFSIGLAGVLTGIGLLLVYAQRLFERFPSDGRLIRAISVVSAAVVTVAGLVISAGALAQMGFLG
jgi:ABC-type nickel/cobalt efflux system permease component RcnA